MHNPTEMDMNAQGDMGKGSVECTSGREVESAGSRAISPAAYPAIKTYVRVAVSRTSTLFPYEVRF